MEKRELMRKEDLVSCGSPDHAAAAPLPDTPGLAAGPHPGTEPSAPPQELLASGLSAGCEYSPALFPPKPMVFQAEESILYISVDEAKDAFVQFMSSKCCSRSVPAEQLEVQSLTALNTYRYQLQTFTESRSTLPASEPYRGGFVDSPEVAVPPGPWDVAVTPPPLFTDCEMHVPVPHTYRVQGCPCCAGTGRAPCSHCGGSAKSTCVFCGGSGRDSHSYDTYSSCPGCSGSGRMRCVFCHGKGWVPCARCDMKGLLLCHSELTITWRNRLAEYVVDKNQGFPLSRFQEVTGKQLFSDEDYLLRPLAFPLPVLRGAESCLALHQMQVSGETRILRQKHAVELIPLTKAEYDWKGKGYSFYVFGNEKQVYAEDYPGKCCCAIL